jgi:subtilisin family serine protease
VTDLTSVADADILLGSAGVDASAGSPVAIASIDTGVEMSHPEFGGLNSANVVAGYDYYSNDPDPSDTNDHGTHTTGTMVGKTVGVAGAVGAASLVTAHVYRVCGGNGCPTSAIVSAIYDATDAGVVAMNLSLGGGSLSQSEADAIAYATARGSLVIAAAGNDGTGTVSCPACDPNAISVAATDWMDEQAYYTNWGSGLDIAAPGGEVYSNTTPESGIYSSVRGGGYAYFQGTSMATPHVTGAAAVIASMGGLTTPDATRSATLRALLLCNTADLGSAGYDENFGNGRLDLAVSLAAGAATSCAETGEFAFSLTTGKIQRGINAVRIDGWTGYSGSTVDMQIQEIGRWDRDVSAGYVYSTNQKGGATYMVEVCTRGEAVARCGTQQVVF